MRSVFILMLVALPTLSAIYHVQKTGNDNGTTGPFLTISKAAQVAQPGDEIIVHAGVYREWVQPPRGGTSESARIVYKAAPGEVVEIKGSERVTTWVSQSGGVWKADVQDGMFGAYHPYTMNILGRYPSTGEWLRSGSWCHLGDVYLDNNLLLERQSQSDVQNNARTWYTSHSGTTTSIYANFGSADPNTQLAEISVRECVFGTPNGSDFNINFITVDGFNMSQSAEEWTPTYLGTPLVSHAVVFASGSNWIIQNCVVKNAKMRGISIDGPGRTTDQIVRNNVVTECGVSGIAGCGAYGSLISGNWVSDIHGNRPYGGVEHACIKLHLTSNTTFSGNVLRRMNSGGEWGFGIWLDWPRGGNRVTGNFITEISTAAIMFENPSGVNQVDNNVMVGTGNMFMDGNVLAHNLFVNCNFTFENCCGYSKQGIYNKVYNNMYIGGSSGLPQRTGNAADYNTFLNGAGRSFDDAHSVTDNTPANFSHTIDFAAKTVTISFDVGSASTGLSCPILNTSYFGNIPSEGIRNPDGSAVTLDKDSYQLCRGTTPRVGAFQALQSGRNTFVLRPNSDFNWRTACQALTPRFTSVAVSPAMANVKPGQTRQFTASALDQYGTALATQPSSFTWSVSGGGTINALGLFAAGSIEGGPFTVTARATMGGETKDGTATATVTSSSMVVAVNAGGPAAGTFSADQFYSGGSIYNGTSTVSTTGVANAGPAEVYQSERYGNFTYTMAGLTAGRDYTVRLHFAEIYHTSAGARVFSVTVNGSAALANFDIFAVAGGKDKALVRDVAATANGSGQIVIGFVTITDQAKVSGIEILEGGATVVPFSPSLDKAATQGLRCIRSGRQMMQLSIRRHGDHEIRVINSSGALIRRFCGTGPSSYGLNTASLGAGLYFVEARAGHTAVGQQTMVIR